MANIFFNSTINYNNKNLLERMGDECFAPIRYLFNGLKITVVQKNISDVEVEYPQDHWAKTAAAIIILIPSLLLGTLLKGLATISSSVREYRQIAADYFANGDNNVSPDLSSVEYDVNADKRPPLDKSILLPKKNKFNSDLKKDERSPLIHSDLPHISDKLKNNLNSPEKSVKIPSENAILLDSSNTKIEDKKCTHDVNLFSHGNFDLMFAISHLSKSKTFTPEKLSNLLNSVHMQDYKMQNTLIEVSKVFQANLLSNSKKITQTSKRNNSYGFTLDGDKVYVRFEVIGTGANKKVRRALGLHSLREYAHQTIKGEDSNSAWVETQNTIKALDKLKNCRHIIPKHKFMVAVDGKKQRKYVLITKLFKGDANLLLKMPLTVRAKALQDAAEGLSDMHDRNLIYSDFKLDNMLIDENQHGLLSDFGTLSTPTKSMGSSRAYQSPESLDEKSPQYIFGTKSDSWSLGICMLMLAAPELFAIDPETKNLLPWISCMKPFFRYNQSDIEQLFENAKISINNSSCTKDQSDIAHELLNISHELLTIDHNQRMSCKEAAELLALLNGS